MKPRIAIQPDTLSSKGGEKTVHYTRWQELCSQRGWPCELVDINSHDFAKNMYRYDAFMWRVGPFGDQRTAMRRIAQLYEAYGNTALYPSSKTLNTSSKLEQTYFLNHLGIATPDTFFFLREDEALRFVEQADYPFVVKLDTGHQSKNVALVSCERDAKELVALLFGPGLQALNSANGQLQKPKALSQLLNYQIKPALKILLGRPYHQLFWGEPPDHGYLYAQEFIASNQYDTRITVVGNKAFGARRYNRKNDFRASGSDERNVDPAEIDPAMLRLGFEVADRMQTQTNAMDFVYKDGKPVLIECNLSVSSWAIKRYPGYWTRDSLGSLVWHEEPCTIEDLIFEDIVTQLAARGFS